MTPFTPQQGWYTALILALLAPILLSIGVPVVARLWTGVSFVWFMLALLTIFIVLSWAFARIAFAPSEQAEAAEDEA